MVFCGTDKNLPKKARKRNESCEEIVSGTSGNVACGYRHAFIWHGKVTIKNTGIAYITAKAKTDSVKITIKAYPKKPSVKSLSVGESRKLTVKQAANIMYGSEALRSPGKIPCTAHGAI